MKLREGTLPAHLAVISANIIFGATFSVVKLITPSLIAPLSLNVVRIVISVALFWSLLLFNPSKPGIQRSDLLRFLICAVTGVAINQIFYIKGISLTTPIHGALLMLGTPIMITFIAAWLLKEKLTPTKLTGLLLGITGAAVLVLQRTGSSESKNMLLGDLLIILNAASYAFYLVLVKPLMERYSPVEVIRWVCTFGAFIIVPVGWNDFTQTNWQAFTPQAWAALAFVVVGATFLAYLFNIYGVHRLGASVTGAYIYSQPLFAAAISMIFTGETLTGAKVLSAVLIFAGVYLSTFQQTSGSSDSQKTKNG